VDWEGEVLCLRAQRGQEMQGVVNNILLCLCYLMHVDSVAET
jgi:hypothetical protein